MGRPVHDETSCSKDIFIFIFMICLLDHILGVVAIVGMPLHFLDYDHGRLALNETPYPSSANKIVLLLHIFMIKRGRLSTP